MVSETQSPPKQIKKLKSANKQADIQAFLLSLHSKPPFPKQRFRNIHPKKRLQKYINMKFIEKLKNRYINKNTNAFLYVNLPHNRWITSAQQLMDKRTTAVVRFTIVYSATTDTISSNNLSYLFQQLMPVLSASLPTSINAPIHYREQTEAHLYRTAKA